MSPRPLNRADSEDENLLEDGILPFEQPADLEDENLMEDGILPFEQPADLVQNNHNLPEPSLHFEHHEQLMYYPIMYPPSTYREGIMRAEEPLRVGEDTGNSTDTHSFWLPL